MDGLLIASLIVLTIGIGAALGCAIYRTAYAKGWNDGFSETSATYLQTLSARSQELQDFLAKDGGA